MAFGRFGKRSAGNRDRNRLERWLNDVTHQIHRQLDSERVFDVCSKALQRILRPGSTSVWLVNRKASFRLAVTTGRKTAEPAVPEAVHDCSRRRRAVYDTAEEDLAVPILTPRGALVGAVHLNSVKADKDQQWFVESVARELGLALERISLYEQAIGEKEKTEAILAGIGDCVVVTDTAGTVTQWNDAAERIIGCPRSQAVGRHCSEVLGLRVGEHALDCSDGCALLAASEASNDALGQEAWRLLEGERRQPLLATASVVRDRDGEVSEVVHSLRDITRLKEADEAKTLFLATASHELKTPLTVIQGFTETLSSGTADETREKQALEAVHRRAKQLNGIVDRILLSSRIEAGKAKISCEQICIEPILSERVAALRAASQRDVSLEIEGGLPEVMADQVALITVLDHLLENAVKYSPDGGNVSLAVRHTESEVYLRVADEGIGMDPEQAARCFEKFWQAESSDVRRFGGTGIGLYIVRSLVEAMGGSIEVETAVGSGTAFTFSLPRAAAPVEPEPSPPGEGDPSVIREFMRQIGVPARR
jgi:PAS domain S-box-containing protein